MASAGLHTDVGASTYGMAAACTNHEAQHRLTRSRSQRSASSAAWSFPAVSVSTDVAEGTNAVATGRGRSSSRAIDIPISSTTSSTTRTRARSEYRCVPNSVPGRAHHTAASLAFAVAEPASAAASGGVVTAKMPPAPKLHFASVSGMGPRPFQAMGPLSLLLWTLSCPVANGLACRVFDVVSVILLQGACFLKTHRFATVNE